MRQLYLDPSHETELEGHLVECFASFSIGLYIHTRGYTKNKSPGAALTCSLNVSFKTVKRAAPLG